MSFTSVVFLIIFFPIFIMGYFLKKEYRNVFLCILSVLFYLWCGLKFLILMLLSATCAYIFGLLIEKAKSVLFKRSILTLAVLLHVGVLFFYKYLFDLFPDLLNMESPALPMGISFYTFSILSYILDVYWEKCKAQRNLLNVWFYVLFFPKVIQGPIMRYSDFEAQLYDRNTDIDTLNAGFERFIKGMAKKVFIADRIQPVVAYSFQSIGEVGTIPAWIGLLAYLIQLYYDFSGYSDMAIGLGKMMGFTLPENFDHPYLSGSVGEYWRRWHISLGEWFRDYIYTPVLRILLEKKLFIKSKNQMMICDLMALLAVWVLTGIWHGSGVKFFAWGMWYFAFIAIERIRDNYRKKRRKLKKIKGKKNTPLQNAADRLLAIIAVVFGQVIFRADSLAGAVEYWKRMLIWDKRDGFLFVSLFDHYTIFIMIIGVIFFFPVYEKVKEKLIKDRTIGVLLYRIGLLCFALIAFYFAISAGYSAFLYEVF